MPFRAADIEACLAPDVSLERVARLVERQVLGPDEQRLRRWRAFQHGAEAQHGERMGVQAPVCLLYTSPSPRDRTRSRMPSSA